MAPDDQDDLRARVEKLESEVERLRRQLDQQHSSTLQSGPPPVINRPAHQANPFESTREDSRWTAIEHIRTSQRRSPVPPQPPRPTEDGEQPAAKKRIDTEFKFGSQVLPRVGIALVLLGILYLVAYAIQNGLITMQAQFVGEICCA